MDTPTTRHHGLAGALEAGAALVDKVVDGGLQQLRYVNWNANQWLDGNLFPSWEAGLQLQRTFRGAVLDAVAGKRGWREVARESGARLKSGVRFQRLVDTLGKAAYGSAVFAGEVQLAEDGPFKLSYLPPKAGALAQDVAVFHAGGVIPYGGTFLVFSDYCRPAIRLSALQQVRVIYVMTHDSIGLGEDGPTHQPIEHLQSLRAIPNLLVMRPGDAVETAECWELALQQKKRPTVLALSRQGLTQYRTEAADENRSAKGAYRVKESAAERRVILIATGSEVGLALDVAAHLEERDIGADVVSMPCAELFDEQSPAYRDKILPNAAPDEILRVSIEAGTTFGWDRYTMSNGLRIGIDSFGTSAPGTDAYEHFGLTSEAIVPRIIAKLEA